MADRSGVRGVCWSLLCGAVLCGGPAWGQDAAPRKQLPADQRAFKAARAVHDPAQRLAAMRSFVATYPKSSRAGTAEGEIFAVLLKSFPERTGEIERQAKVLVKQSGKGLSRDHEEAYRAFQMAEAGTDGVDLKLAGKLAKDAVKRTDEATFDRETTASYVKFKTPVPKPAEMHAEFATARAGFLAVLANVKLREGRRSEAEALTHEAYALDPMVDDVNTMQGRLALAAGKDAEAMDWFERAQLLGTISAVDRAKMIELYRSAHGGSDAGFEAAMDARYAEIFPAGFRPAAVKPVTGGHPVLVELFTGSGCPPCVGGDLAVEALMEAYPRSEVVALAFDQHIPEPDPLANADSVARAAVYGVTFTPTFVVDGRMQDAIYGGPRGRSEEVYGKLQKVVDAEAARPTGVALTLSASEGVAGAVSARARVTLPRGADLEKAIAAGAPAEAAGKGQAAAGKGAAAAGKAASAPKVAEAANPPEAPRMVVNFALVEDGVRYSGENGVRFHRMVVRSLLKPAGEGFAVAAGGSAEVEAAFDPAAIQHTLEAYLGDYAQHNERFGPVTFLTTDMTMRRDHLLVAAWVQDAVSHRVLATALMPLAPNGQKEGAE